jgi:hypothetical protein
MLGPAKLPLPMVQQHSMAIMVDVVFLKNLGDCMINTLVPHQLVLRGL